MCFLYYVVIALFGHIFMKNLYCVITKAEVRVHDHCEFSDINLALKVGFRDTQAPCMKIESFKFW